MCGVERPYTVYIVLRPYSLHGALRPRCMVFRDLIPSMMS